MLPLAKGRFTARRAVTVKDTDHAKALRHLCFVTHRGLATTFSDVDTFDSGCQHILVEDTQTLTVVCCFRLMHFTSGADISTSYSSQFYDLSRLSAYPGRMAELGRFCIHPDWSDPDILRLAWGMLTAIVDATGVELLIGCTSFDGADPAIHQDALALLKDRYVAPDRFRPGQKSPHAYAVASFHFDPKRGLATMPPLLRTYLMMGGWVSDHAVIDPGLNTLHVFTGLEVRAIPPARARALRALAG